MAFTVFLALFLGAQLSPLYLGFSSQGYLGVFSQPFDMLSGRNWGEFNKQPLSCY